MKKDLENTYPISTLAGESKKEFVDFITKDFLRKKRVLKIFASLEKTFDEKFFSTEDKEIAGRVILAYNQALGDIKNALFEEKES